MRSLSILLIFILYACSDKTMDKHPTRKYSTDSAFTLLDLKYSGDSLNKMDIYLPAHRTNETKTILYLHSGGWAAGDKSQYSYACKEICNNGKYVVANLNYRFISPQRNYKAMLEDIDKAIAYLKNNSEDLVLDKNRFGLYGVSAGGHLALLYGYKNPDDVNVIISICGPASINDLHFKKIVDSAWMSPHLLPMLIGKPFELNSSEVKDCSPIDNISNVPTLFVHGTDDETVPYDQALKLDATLKDKKVKHYFISVPGGTDTSLGPQGGFYKDSIDKAIIKWIKEN